MTHLEADIRKLAAQRHLPDVHLERWLLLNEASRRAFLEVALALKLRTGQLIATLDLLDEISVREKTDIAALLCRPPFRKVIDGAGARPGRARAFVEELRALRFPRLREATAGLEAAIASVHLPRGIKLLLPRELASDELTIQLVVTEPKEMDRLLDILMAKRGEISRILSMLGGRDEV